MTIRRLFAGLACACLFFFSTQSHTAVVLGADTSWLSEMEANGNLFYNSSGTQQDLFPILKQHGMSAVRLRVWVNPQNGYNGMTDVLAKAGHVAADIDWVVPHQANLRILDATARKLGLPIEKVVITVSHHANTSAASVALAFDTAWRDGRIKRGDLVMLEAMGGGFTWGAAVLRV